MSQQAHNLLVWFSVCRSSSFATWAWLDAQALNNQEEAAGADRALAQEPSMLSSHEDFAGLDAYEVGAGSIAQPVSALVVCMFASYVPCST